MECGECTLCCKVLPVGELKSPAGEYCKHCTIGVGCSIYSQRPKVCRDFLCSYAQVSNVSIELRPDKCGAIFEKISDKVFLGTREDGIEINQFAKKQIKEFNIQGFSVVINSQNGLAKLYLAPGHNRDEIMLEVLERQESQGVES